MRIFQTVVFLLSAVVLACGFEADFGCKGCKNIEVIEKNGIYIFRIPDKGGYSLKPYVSEKLVYNKDVFQQTGAELVVNAGYFDIKNEETTSYVVVDNYLALDPTLNNNLMDNEQLKPHLKEILNRTELRILDCNGEVRYDICAHNAKVPYRCKIKHSLQAGPLVYPDLRLKKEYFLRTKGHDVLRDSIQSLQRRPRTIIGLKDNDVYIFIVTLKNPLSLIEVQDLCAELRLDKAMNFDGGGSTSVDFKGTNNQEFKNLHIVSENNGSARKLKSFLIVE